MVLIEILSAALGIAVVSLVGRTLLAWLPAGELGSHRTAELPVTCAASYVLGCIAVGGAAGLSALLGLKFSSVWIGVGAALLLLARRLMLPAALVPRHAVQAERPGNASRVLLLIALCIVVFAAWRMQASPHTGAWAAEAQALISQGHFSGLDAPSGGALAKPPLHSASLAFAASMRGAVSSGLARADWLACALAVLLLAERAMAIARRAPLGRRALLIPLAMALAAAASAEDVDVTLAAMLALLVCGLLSWTRRADGRGLALVCLASGALPLADLDGWVFGSAALIAVVACSASNSRRRAAIWAAAAGLLPMAIWPLASGLRGVPWLAGEAWATLSSSWALAGDPWLGAWIAPIWIAFGAAAGPALLRLTQAPHVGLDAAHADRTRRDLAALLLVCAVIGVEVLLAMALIQQPISLLARTWAPGLLVAAAPLAAVIAARSLLRAERDA